MHRKSLPLFLAKNKCHFLTVSLLLFFLTIQLKAQEAKKKIGEITPEEIAMTHCDFDTAASAIVLFDIGKSRFVKADEYFYLKFTRHKRIKLFKEAGREHATISIPYYVASNGRKEEVTKVEAYTYNMVNGKLEKQALDASTVYDEKINANWYRKKFVFPNVQEGSIMEYSIVLTSPFLFNLRDWNFQSSIPTLYSEYNTYIMPLYKYVSYTQGIAEWDVRKSWVGNEKFTAFGYRYFLDINKFGLKNIEAFKDESYISSVEDYIKKIDFQLSQLAFPDGRSEDYMTTWKDQRKYLLEDESFGMYIRGSKRFAKKIVKEELKLTEEQPDEEKIKQIVEYVKNRFNWSGRLGKYATETPKTFIKNNDGNAAAINLFLIALLRAADIEADPLILSTRGHGKLMIAYPFITATNYVVAYLPKSKKILDGTARTLDRNLLPTYCINGAGLLVDKEDEDRWFTIKYSNIASLESIGVEMEIDPINLVANMTVNTKNTFFKAYRKRETYGDKKEDIKEILSEKFDEVKNIEVTGYEDASKPYVVSYEAQKEIESLGEYLIINPLLELPMNENPLILEERSYPIDMIYPNRNRYDVKIQIPDGYSIVELPKDVAINDDLVSIQARYIFDEATNKLRVGALYEFKKDIYEPKEYKQLKKHIDTIVETMNTKINLKKN